MAKDRKEEELVPVRTRDQHLEGCGTDIDGPPQREPGIIDEEDVPIARPRAQPQPPEEDVPIARPPEGGHLAELLAEAQDQIQKQDDLIRSLTAPPFAMGTVILKSPGGIITDPGIIVSVDGKILEVAIPHNKLRFVDPYEVVEGAEVEAEAEDAEAEAEEGVVAEENDDVDKLPKEVQPTDISPGDTVKVNVQTMAIVDKCEAAHLGDTVVIKRILEDDPRKIEIESGGQPKIVMLGASIKEPEIGSRLLIDSSYTIAVEDLGKDAQPFTLTNEINMSWDEIGGLVEEKALMKETIEFPFKYADLYKFYQKKPLKGVLLYGPPGCGKTMLAKATASSLATISGAPTASGFIYVKGPEILDKFVGVAEATIRMLFARARDHKEEYEYPAVIFIDEADAILGKRGSGISSDMEKTIVPMFLAEMDGLEDSGAIVILATNRSDTLDPAVVRDGRIDRKIRINRPNQQSAVEIFSIYLGRVPVEGSKVSEMATVCSDLMYSSDYALYRVRMRDEADRFVTLGHLINGAMITSIVDQASSLAIHRDIANGAVTEGSGVTLVDVETALAHVRRQNLHLNHKDDVDEVVAPFRGGIAKIEKIFS